MSRPPVVEATLDTHEAGDAIFRVSRRSRAAVERYFAYGQRYRLEEVDEVQQAIDRRFHVTIRELWETLPESDDERFSSADNFRYWALIKCGYCNTSYLPCGSEKNAQDNAAFIMAMMSRQGFCIVQVQGDTIAVTRPLSQSKKAGDMDKEKLRESYRDVEEFVTDFVREAHERIQERRMQARLEEQRKLPAP